MNESPQGQRQARRGRRPGDPETREAILDAALALFAERGYDGASMRAVAERAGVDTGMIRHWFGDKQGLFAATILNRTPVVSRLSTVLADPSPGRGRRLASAYLDLWEDAESGPILMALVRTSTSDSGVPAAVRRAIGGGVMDREYTGNPADTGLALVGSHMLGVAITRYVVQLPALATMPRDVLLDQLGPVLDSYLNGN